MDISFHALSANRWLTKAKVRHRDAIEALVRTGAFVSTDNLPFDILQVILLDRDPSYARADRSKDRILQFEVAAPNSAEIDFSDAKAFVGYLADRLEIAINGCGLPREIAAEVIESIKEFKRTL